MTTHSQDGEYQRARRENCGELLRVNDEEVECYLPRGHAGDHRWHLGPSAIFRSPQRDQEHARPSGKIVQAWQQEINRNDLQGLLLSELLQAAKEGADALAETITQPLSRRTESRAKCAEAALRTVIEKIEKER